MEDEIEILSSYLLKSEHKASEVKGKETIEKLTVVELTLFAFFSKILTVITFTDQSFLTVDFAFNFFLLQSLANLFSFVKLSKININLYRLSSSTSIEV